MARPTKLEARLRAILDANRDRGMRRRQTGVEDRQIARPAAP